jgi:hypothetical protein
MTDEDDAALVIKTGIEQMFVPLHQLLDKLQGPAAAEVGLSLGDSVKVWRLKRQVRLLQEVKRLLEHTCKDIKPIATRLFFPILDAASIEDDDEMQTRWAALLANEATNSGVVHPSYIEILRQLAPGDAQLLDRLCDWCERHKIHRITNRYSIPINERDREMVAILESCGTSLENLIRLGLIQSGYNMPNRGYETNVPSDLDSWYEVSEFALRFVRACRAPADSPDA